MRIILSIAAAQNLDLFQFDVSSAFLHGDFTEEIYLEQPDGFRSNGREEDVYRLHKWLYGLKQAGRVWNFKFYGLLKAFGLTPSSVGICVYCVITRMTYFLFFAYGSMMGYSFVTQPN